MHVIYQDYSDPSKNPNFKDWEPIYPPSEAEIFLQGLREEFGSAEGQRQFPKQWRAFKAGGTV